MPRFNRWAARDLQDVARRLTGTLQAQIESPRLDTFAFRLVGGWGRLADGPRARWVTDIENGAAVGPPVPRATWQAAVEKIVAASSMVVPETASFGELRHNFESVEGVIGKEGVRH